MALDTAIDFTSLDTVALLASDAAVDARDDLGSAGKIGADLQGKLVGLSTALVALQKAKSTAEAYRAAPAGTVLAQQVYQAQLAAAQALEAATVAHAAYTTALDQAPAALYEKLLPKPTRAERWPLLVDQTTKLLEALAPEERAPGAAKLLAAALGRGDTDLAYVLAGKNGPMTLAYARLGVSESALALYFGPVLAQARAQYPGLEVKGQKLYARLQRTGSANALRKTQVAVAASLHYLRNG